MQMGPLYQNNSLSLYLGNVYGALGLEETEFSSHSFRIEAVTEAARCGLDTEAVKRIGGWESRRFRFYYCPHLRVGMAGGWGSDL